MTAHSHHSRLRGIRTALVRTFPARARLVLGALVAVLLAGTPSGPVAAGAPAVEGDAAIRAVQPLGPCLLPHPDTASYVAVFRSLGWRPVSEGPEFDRAALASGEILLAIRALPRGFENQQEVDRYLNAARQEGRRRGGSAHSALLVKGEMNLLIQSGIDRNRLSVGCYLTAPRLAEVEQSGSAEPIKFGERVLAVAMTTVKVPALPGVKQARSSLLRLFMPETANAASPGTQGITLFVGFEPGVTGNRVVPTTGAETAAVETPDTAPAAQPGAGATGAFTAQALARLAMVQCSLPGYSLAQRIAAFRGWHQARPAEIARFMDIFADGVQAMEIVERGSDRDKAAEIRARVAQVLFKRLTAPIEDLGQAPTRLLVSDADPAVALAIGENGSPGKSGLTCNFLLEAPARELVGGLTGLFVLSIPRKSDDAEIRRMTDSLRADNLQQNYTRRLIVLGPATQPRAAVLFTSMITLSH